MDDYAPAHSDGPDAPSYADVAKHNVGSAPPHEDDEVILGEVPSPIKEAPAKVPGETDPPEQDEQRQTATKGQQTEYKKQGKKSDRAHHHGMGIKDGRTVLQRHCDFFDPDGDGVIYPWDTFFGFYVLGYALPLCLFAAFIIHFSFSYPTAPHFPLPDPLFRVYIKKISAGKHGSDTGAYDHDGGFDENRFEMMFKKNAKSRPDALSRGELFDMMRRNRMLWDPFGWTAAFLEWGAVYLMIWPRDTYISKEDIHEIYDGSIFYKVAAREKRNGRLTPPGWQSRVKGLPNP